MPFDEHDIPEEHLHLKRKNFCCPNVRSNGQPILLLNLHMVRSARSGIA